jgi:hypothetical protein
MLSRSLVVGGCFVITPKVRPLENGRYSQRGSSAESSLMSPDNLNFSISRTDSRENVVSGPGPSRAEHSSSVFWCRRLGGFAIKWKTTVPVE